MSETEEEECPELWHRAREKSHPEATEGKHLLSLPPSLPRTMHARGPSRTHTLTSPNNHGFDQLCRVEAGLDDGGATEQGVPPVGFWAVGFSLQGSGVLGGIGQVGLGDGNTLP